MASVTEKPQTDSPPQTAQRAGERLVDKHISRTRRALKLVDFTAGMITLTIGVLIYLLAMAVLEHWVIPGGWSDTARKALFAVLLIGIAVYCWRKFWPLLRLSINPAYAAQAIEEHSPSLKNSLLNLLLLRSNKRQLSRQVYQAIEQQAEQGLTQVRMESVVDRSAILRLGYLLVALTAICALYRFISPKDLIASAGRVLLPWANIATPSRVQILDVTPGDTKAARGEQVEISAEVLGLEEDEPVRLYYTTADEQIVRQEVPMSASAGGARFSCRVPGRIGFAANRGSGGIQQDFSYWVEAGDARSPRYKVAVFARPTIVVNRLRYEYPTYTGYPTREVEHTGDIRAVEGTRVTIYAQANKAIKSSHVDFEADGRRDLLMNSTGQEATVTFPLELRDDRRTPRYSSYALRYLTTDDNQNLQPPKYQIDVQPDYSPEIQLVLPEQAMLEVALNQEVNFELDARDPDFALSQVVLIGKVGEEQKLQEPLLATNHTGRFVGKLRKTPAEMGLKVGDVMEYWGVAADNRRPEPNLAYSAHRKIRVKGPWQGNEQGEPGENGEAQQQQGGDNESQQGEQGQEGQSGGGEQGESGQGDQNQQGEGGQGQQGGEGNDDNQQQGQGGKGEPNPDDQQPSGDSQGNSQDSAAGEPSENQDSQNQSGESSNDPTQGEGGGEQGKVSPDGDDDGSAFERMAKHFEEQAEQNGEGSEQAGDQQSGEGDRSDGDNQAKSESEAADGSPDSNQTGESASPDGDTGKGAQGDPAPGKEQDQGDPGDKQQQDGDAPAGEMSPEQGEAGRGDSTGKEQGAPNADNAQRPRDRQGDQGDGPKQENQEAAAEAQANTESDSESSQGGDRSGGGKEGAGQQADAAGKGGAGENQAADQGAGKAAEQGEGEAGERAGDQETAKGKTGESSEEQAGEGSKESDQPGEKPGGAESNQDAGEGQSGQQSSEPNDAKPTDKDEQQPNHQQQQDPSESASADGQSPASEAGGTGGKPSAPPPAGETQPGDDANLDYARKQTDLILERLDDQLQKKEVDKSLLEKLGWTQDELRRFVDRWKSLKSQADDKPDATAASEELNGALRSLGLKPKRTGFQSKITKDKLRDLQDAYRGRVPLEYQEQVNRYIKGTATAQEEE